MLPSGCCLFSAVQALASCRHKTPSTCLRLLETRNGIVYSPENLTNSFENRCLLSTHLDRARCERCSLAPTQWTETVFHAASVQVHGQEPTRNLWMEFVACRKAGGGDRNVADAATGMGRYSPLVSFLLKDFVQRAVWGTHVQWQTCAQG